MKRISKYIPGCDGTRLAVDVYLPEGEARVPVLIKAGYQQRRKVYEGEREAIDRFVADGYAVAIVEVRGAGASFGVSDGFFGPRDGKDLACVTEALAAEPWCSGKAGTYGGSNYGMSQEINLIEQPAALQASLPCDCSMDFYDQDFPNGASALPQLGGGRDPNRTPEPDAPVDGDADGALLREAAKAHERNLPFLAQHRVNMCRDDVHPYLGYRPNLDVPVWERMDDARFGHVRVWSLGAWFDPGCTNKIITWKWWGGRLTLGPWMHCGLYRGGCGFPEGDLDWVAFHKAWFDRHLKGVQNDIEEQPPVRYYTVGAEHPWRWDADFPVAGTTFPKLYLGADGALTEKAGESGTAVYTVREDINIYGPFGRMNRNNPADMRDNDAKSLVFTGEPLPADLEITGIPVLDLYVTSSHPDGNFIAALEEVLPDGSSHFLTEGVIRASHAKTHRNPAYQALGIPYHRGYREDMVSLSPQEPLRLSFHLEALSRVVRAGSRLRLAVSCGGSGYQQPEGFPGAGEAMPVIRLHTGAAHPSALTLPVIRPVATRFETVVNGKRAVAHVFARAIYLETDGRFQAYPCRQAYPSGAGEMTYVTEAFTARVRTEDGAAVLRLDDDSPLGAQTVRAALPRLHTFGDITGEIPPALEWGRVLPAHRRNLYVATVPVSRGVKGNMNPMMRNTFDLFVDLIYPDGVAPDAAGARAEKLPCIVNIHGFGGSHHFFESNTELLLARGYAVASIDYRLTPPETWEAPCADARGCIRYLKAHAGELGLDPERFGVIGCSMGGYLTAMLAAANGDPAEEGDIGGNTDWDSSVKAAAAYFAPTDILHFGDDAAWVWPAQPDKAANGDGPFAPPASMTGHLGYGKGMADIKAHLFDPDPAYVRLREITRRASPISYVSEKSAPLCLVHGIFDCGIQVPMGQSVRMFEAYTRKGVKALLLCNNNGLFGEDPEVKRAVVDFLTARV